MKCIPFFKLLLSAVTKLRKATISFVMSAHLSVCPRRKTRLRWTDLHETAEYFSKIVEKIQVSLKSDKNNGHFT